MHDDDASWKAQVQIGLKARQRVNACVQKLGALPDWRPVRAAFTAFFAALEELWQEVQAVPDRLQALPELLKKDLLTVSHWRYIEKEGSIELLLDLWQGWTTGILTARHSSKESELRAELLNLYIVFSGIADDYDINFADQIQRQGIFYGEKFLALAESKDDINLLQFKLLQLYANTINMYDIQLQERINNRAKKVIVQIPSSRREIELSVDQLVRQAVTHAEQFMENNENYSSETQMNLLRIYSKAEWLEDAEALQIYCRGIKYGKQFLANETNDTKVREYLLSLYYQAGVLIHKMGKREAADRFFRQGIACGKQFLTVGETSLYLRECLLRIYLNATINMWIQEFYLFYMVMFKALKWEWCISEENEQLKTRENKLYFYSSIPNSLQFWNETLYQFLLHFKEEELHHKQETINTLILLNKALLLQKNTKDNTEFCNHFMRWIPLKEQIEEKVKVLEQQHQRLKDAIGRLFSEDQPELDNLYSRFAELSLWQRLRHYFSFRSIQKDKLVYQNLLHQSASIDKNLWSNIQNCQQLFRDWLAKRWLDYAEIPSELEEPMALLGIVFAAQHLEPPETTLERWQAIQPWADPKDLNEAMTRAGWANVVLPAETSTFALYPWAGRIGQPRLTIAEETLNFAGPALIETLRAYHQGNPEPLQRTLEYAWTQAQEKAPAFARLLRMLSSVQGTVESLAPDSDPPPSEQEVRTALAALILGDTRAVLTQALHGRLDQQWPLTPDTPLAEAQLCLKRRFSTLVSLSPGPRHHRELAERLHAWCQQALRRELAAPTPDVTEIWNTLEHSRVALLGLKVKAPDPAWEEETARRIHAVLQHTSLVPPPDNPGLIWPPFQCWLDRLKEAGLLPELPTIADCQHRLRADEALVRLFFDPGSGQLFALWLEPDRAVELRRLDSATDWPHWRAFDDHDPAIQDRRKRWEETAKKWGLGGDDAEPGVLDRWERWLEKEQSRPFPAVFHKVMTSPAVTTVVDTLQAWCRQTARTRLIILLPAPLAQLPWEVLPPFDSGRITLERAVSLSHWRVSPDPTQPDNPDDHPDQPPLGVFFDSRPDSVILGRWQAQRAGTFWNRAVLGTDDGLTAFDILTHLHRHANGHLLLHGEYRQDDPRRSHLQLQSDEHLYAWTASAVGVRGGLLGLATCQANLSGATTQTLLASVGLGPALIASGAAAVIGPLWSCAQWAALVFFHRLFELARQEPLEPWSRLLQRAREDLRQVTKADLLKLFKFNNLAEAEQQFQSFLDNYPELGDPPFGDNPFYWAPFILLGEDRRTDPHGINPGA